MLRVLSETCINIESLYLKDCRGISTPSIACFLQRTTQLTLLDLAGLDSVKNSTLQVIGQCLPHLEKLNLSWCKNISGEGIQLLVTDGGQCHSLTLLNLNGVPLIDEITVGHLVDHSPNLRQLSLASCSSLTDAAFARLLLPSTLGYCRLSRLNVSNCTRLSDHSLRQLALHGGDQLTHLELAGCNRLTDSGFTFLAIRLRSLIYLDLEDVTQITSLTIKALANNQPHLKRLCLSNCIHIGDEAIEFLLLHGVCTTLEYLELDECGISDAFLDTMATFLANQQKTRAFTLQQSSSTDSGFIEATFGSSTCSSERQGRSSCSINNDVQPRVLTIRVLDCSNISETGIRSAMNKAAPYLIIKSFYSWRDENDPSYQQEQQHQHQHRTSRHISTGRTLGGGGMNRNVRHSNGHPSSGCIIL